MFIVFCPQCGRKVMVDLKGCCPQCNLLLVRNDDKAASGDKDNADAPEGAEAR